MMPLYSDLIMAGFGIIVTLIGAFIRSLMNRIKVLEDKVENKMDQRQVKELVSDKLDPLKEDLSEIKAQLVKLTDYLLINKHNDQV